MNELSIDTLKQEMQQRRMALKSKKGFDDAKKVMLAMFDYFANSGYKMPDADYDEMAGVYADQLREHLVVYGYDVLKNAAREFVRNDRRDYHPIPTAGQLIAVIEEMQDSPLATIRKKEFEQFVEKITEETHKELQGKWDELSSEEKKRLEERYGRYRQD